MRTKNLEKFNKKNGCIKSNYVSQFIFIFNNNTNKYYGKQWTGHNRHFTLIDKNLKMQEILNELGIKYTIGNDSVRGGKSGDFIQIDKKQLNYLRGKFDIKNERTDWRIIEK